MSSSPRPGRPDVPGRPPSLAIGAQSGWRQKGITSKVAHSRQRGWQTRRAGRPGGLQVAQPGRADPDASHAGGIANP